jgi:hypothetical protein
MSVEESSTGEPGALALLRLCVVAEVDPGTLGRILGRLTNLNLTPRRVLAEAGSDDRLYIEIDIVGVSECGLALLAAKTRQDPSVFDAHWHYLC